MPPGHAEDFLLGPFLFNAVRFDRFRSLPQVQYVRGTKSVRSRFSARAPLPVRAIQFLLPWRHRDGSSRRLRLEKKKHDAEHDDGQQSLQAVRSQAELVRNEMRKIIRVNQKNVASWQSCVKNGVSWRQGCQMECGNVARLPRRKGAGERPEESRMSWILTGGRRGDIRSSVVARSGDRPQPRNAEFDPKHRRNLYINSSYE
jgi:hypothetical protein